MSKKYFGTDGIRGKYGDNLDVELAFKTGLALAAYFGKGDYVIGRDTRVSGLEIEEAIVDGLLRGGCNAIKLGVIPTPAVAHIAVELNALCGIVISASHNPAEYNGIKIFDGNGVKLSEEQEGSVEYYIDNINMQKTARGKSSVLTDAHERYIDFLVKTIDADLSGLKVWIDCGYGASGTVARAVFERVGATVSVDNDSGRGEKINAGCGALYPNYIRNSMRGTDYKLGFSLDGDADRLSVVYDNNIIDGDSIIYSLSKSLTLKDGVVVGTVLTNLALEKALEQEGKRLVRTPVGDKFICDLMLKKGYNLGGEQSGHFIIYPQSTTGDGLMSALFLCKTLYKDGKLNPFEPLELCPQKAISEPADQSIMCDSEMINLIEEYTTRLQGMGRLVVRMSGTEPKVRVMCECTKASVVDEVLMTFKKFINKRGM